MESKVSIVSLIDHAVLQPTQTNNDVRTACKLCAELQVASVCVKPSMVQLASELLAESGVVPSTVIGFPHGGTTTQCKVYETEVACREGVCEIDMVVNLGRVLAEDWQYVSDEICAVVDAAKSNDVITKVIFETGLLPSDDLKIRLCEISEEAGAAFVKTSTGFGYVKAVEGSLQSTGATAHDVKLLRKHVSEKMQVKASGGIRSYEDALSFVNIGASRLGTSATVAIAAGYHSLPTENCTEY